jgi:hypothetical protein
MDSEGLLGPLPKPWKVLLSNTSIQRFFNSLTGATTLEDPRFGPLPPGWERIQYNKTQDDPHVVDRFRNMVTGEEINSDPRLLPEALKSRGINLQVFQLI